MTDKTARQIAALRGRTKMLARRVKELEGARFVAASKAARNQLLLWAVVESMGGLVVIGGDAIARWKGQDVVLSKGAGHDTVVRSALAKD